MLNNGESTLPWAMPESCQSSDRSEPLTCENVPCTRTQRKWVADRMCNTSVRDPPQRKPPCKEQFWNGPVLQHDTKEMVHFHIVGTSSQGRGSTMLTSTKATQRIPITSNSGQCRESPRDFVMEILVNTRRLLPLLRLDCATGPDQVLSEQLGVHARQRCQSSYLANPTRTVSDTCAQHDWKSVRCRTLSRRQIEPVCDLAKHHSEQHMLFFEQERKVSAQSSRVLERRAQLTRGTGRPRPRRRSMAPRHQHPNRHGAPAVTWRTPAQHNMTMLCTNV